MVKDKESLLACYDFPAAQWQQIRTTHPLESVFAAVCLAVDEVQELWQSSCPTFPAIAWNTDGRLRKR